jgi:hypothetical protein
MQTTTHRRQVAIDGLSELTSVDIDSPAGLNIAEAVFRHLLIANSQLQSPPRVSGLRLGSEIRCSEIRCQRD